LRIGLDLGDIILRRQHGKVLQQVVPLQPISDPLPATAAGDRQEEPTGPSVLDYSPDSWSDIHLAYIGDDPIPQPPVQIVLAAAYLGRQSRPRVERSPRTDALLPG